MKQLKHLIEEVKPLELLNCFLDRFDRLIRSPKRQTDTIKGKREHTNSISHIFKTNKAAEIASVRFVFSQS